jgi:hypothetical protein
MAVFGVGEEKGKYISSISKGQKAAIYGTDYRVL